MGIDIESKLLVGLPYHEMEDWINCKISESNGNLECVTDVLEYYNLEYSSPWYDSQPSNWFIGVGAKDFGDVEVIVGSLRSSAKKFTEVTGKASPIVSSSQHVY